MRAYKANMIPGGVTPTINVSQYDNDYAVTVTLIEGAEIYTPPAGATIRVEGTKPDGHGFEYPCTYQGNVVTMPIYTQMTVVSGRFPIELVVYQNGLRVGSCNIIFAVEKAPLGEDTDISETVIPDIIDAAQSSAEAAQEAAETAQEAAAQVLASQIVTEASGSIAPFSDGADDVAVKSLVATITPVQNLNGQANPYPPGGGKNKFPITMTTQTQNGTTFTVTDDGVITISGTPTALTRVRLNNLVITPSSGMKFSMTGSATGVRVFVTKTSSGTTSYPTISPDSTLAAGDTFENFYLEVNTNFSGTVTVKIQLEDGTTATDWSPYSNICPISGRTGLTVTRAGKNLATGNITRGLLSIAIGSSIDDVTASTRYGYTERYPARSGLTVTASSANLENFAAFFVLMYNNGILAAQSGAKAFLAVGTKMTYTVPADTYDTVVVIIGADASHATPLSVDGELQAEVGSTATAYEPYAGHTYPITWETEAGTVYGGTLDVVSGVLTVDRVMETITKDGTWYGFVTGSGNASATIQLRDYQNVKYVDGASSRNGAIASTGVEAQNYWVGARQNEIPPDGDMCFAYSSSGQLRFHRSDVANITDLETFKAAFPDTQIVYPLATPQTYQLTPTEVRTILGGNTIYTDAGDVSVEYIADTKMYIDNKIATLQALVLEN